VTVCCIFRHNHICTAQVTPTHRPQPCPVSEQNRKALASSD